MKPELAKQLKDAGFPQPPKPPPEYASLAWHGDVYIPTLSELIEACGELPIIFKSGGRWFAATWEGKFFGDHYIDGRLEYNLQESDTPEEAVAHLWLELNKK